jgi:hypothetical protein
MISDSKNLMHLQNLVNFCKAKFTAYATSRQGWLVFRDQKLSLRKEAIARTAIDAMQFIKDKASGHTYTAEPKYYGSKGNSVVTTEAVPYETYTYNHTYRIEPLPSAATVVLSELFSNNKNVIYLEFIGIREKSRAVYTDGLPVKGTSFQNMHGHDNSYAERYLFHFLDKFGKQQYKWLRNAYPLEFMTIDRGCSFLHAITDRKLDIIVRELSTHHTL